MTPQFFCIPDIGNSLSDCSQTIKKNLCCRSFSRERLFNNIWTFAYLLRCCCRTRDLLVCLFMFRSVSPAFCFVTCLFVCLFVLLNSGLVRLFLFACFRPVDPPVFFFPFSRFLPADQKTWGLWVPDWERGDDAASWTAICQRFHGFKIMADDLTVGSAEHSSEPKQLKQSGQKSTKILLNTNEKLNAFFLSFSGIYLRVFFL